MNIKIDKPCQILFDDDDDDDNIENIGDILFIYLFTIVDKEFFFVHSFIHSFTYHCNWFDFLF